jgi:hypothetical protein
VPTVFTSLAGGQLLVSPDSSDNVAIDHSGSFTFVNQAAFPDAAITQGIHIESGFEEVGILVTVKPVTSDGASGVIFGKAGHMEGIQAPVSLSGDFDIVLDDSNDTNGRTVTLNAVNGVGTISGLGSTITFNEGGLLSEFDGLQIHGGMGGNTFNILNTLEDFTLFGGNVTTTNIDTRAGSDKVNAFATRSKNLNIQSDSPERALAEMRALLKPDDLLVCEDNDLTSAGSEPPSALDVFAKVWSRLGPKREWTIRWAAVSS